eukprot:356969_1
MRHQHSRSHASNGHSSHKRHKQRNGRTHVHNYSLNHIANIDHFNATESSLSNLEEDMHTEEEPRQKPFTFHEDTNRDKLALNIDDLDFAPQNNGFHLNYHGHIANHASPRQITLKSSNPY